MKTLPNGLHLGLPRFKIRTDGLLSNWFDHVPGKSEMSQPMLALFNLGGAEIVLILILLAMLVVPLAAVAVVIFLVVRANKQERELSPGALPLQIPSAGP